MKDFTNGEIRDYAKEKGVYMWQIADVLGVHEGTFCRKLRHDLPPEETEKILAIIDRIAEHGTRILQEGD